MSRLFRSGRAIAPSLPTTRFNVHAALATSLVCATALAGCVDAAWPAASNPATPFAVGGDLVVDDGARGVLWYIVAAPPGSSDAPAVKRVEYDGLRGQTVLAADGKARFWLDSGDVNRAAKVARVGDGAAGVVGVALGAPFSGLRACDDGVGVLAFHADGVNAATLVNTAEIALVDPDVAVAAGSKPGDGVVRATASGLARAPHDGGCSGKIALQDGDHRLVWVMARSAIGLLDIGPTGGKSAVVPLVAPDSTAAISPKQTIAVAGKDSVDLYVIANGSNDVLHLRVGLGGDAPAVSLDQIGLGGVPIALEVFTSSAGLRAVTLNVNPPGVSLVNPETGAAITVPLDGPADAWTLFDGLDGKRYAVTYGAAGTSARISRIALDALEKKKGKAVQSVLSELAVSGVTPAGDRLLLRHGKSSAVSIFDAATGKVSPFKGTGTVVSTLERAGALYVLGNVDYGVSRLSRIALDDLKGFDIDLPRPANALLPFAGDGAGGSGGEAVAVSGDGLGGPWIAIWPNGTAKGADGAPAASFWLEGFALTGAIDAEVK